MKKIHAGVAILTLLALTLAVFQAKALSLKSFTTGRNTVAPVMSEDLPLRVDATVYRPLRSLEDPGLERRLQAKLASRPHWKSLIANKKLAVGLVDLSDPFQVKFAQINGDEMMYAASLPKIAILLSAMDAFEKGELKETPTINQDLNAMIARSSNQASTRMIDRLGYKKIESVLTDPRYELYDEAHGGGLWVGKRYAASGARNPDPIKGLSHAATVAQVCRFYYLLSMGKLVNHERSRQMLQIMDEPLLHHKFVYSLDRKAPQAQVFRKSGSWKDYHSDSALVWGQDPRRRYILVALTQDPNGESIIREIVNVAEETLGL